jgi:hypothetical protein
MDLHALGGGAGGVALDSSGSGSNPVGGRTLVYMVINFRVPKIRSVSSVDE